MTVTLHPMAMAQVLKGMKGACYRGDRFQFVISFDELHPGEGYHLSYKQLIGEVPIGATQHVDIKFGSADDAKAYAMRIEAGQ